MILNFQMVLKIFTVKNKSANSRLNLLITKFPDFSIFIVEFPFWEIKEGKPSFEEAVTFCYKFGMNSVL